MKPIQWYIKIQSRKRNNMALLGREDKPVKLKNGTFLGKGSKQRPIKDRKKFEENWDAIFSKGTKSKD